MKKYIVVADRICLVVEKGSEVMLSDRQFERVRQYVQPIGETVKEVKKVEKKVKKK